MSAPEWFAAVSGEEPALVDSLGQVRGYVVQQEAGESLSSLITGAMATAAECRVIVFVYDVYEAFVGTAYGF